MRDEGFEKIEQNLRSLKNIRPETPFRDGLRLRLVEKIGGEQVQGPGRNFGLRFAFTIGLVAIFLTGGSVVLAENSLPGHPLYPVKRSVENVKLIFVSKKDRSEIEKKLANNRIDELREAVSTEDEQVTTFAIEEVEESINQISIGAISAKNKYLALQEEGKEASDAKKVLEEVLATLEEKQKVLAEIKMEIPDSQTSTLKVMMDNLESLKLEIGKVLKGPTQEKEEPSVKGEETEKTNSNPEEPSPRQ